MRKKWIMVFVLVIASIMALFSACGEAEEKEVNAAYDAENPIVFRLASDAPVEHMSTNLNRELVESIAERTDGRVKIDYYPASQLGSYETVYEEVVLGTIDAAQISIPDYLDSRLGVAYLPYYATGFDDAKKLYGMDSLMTETMEEICAEQDVDFMGFVCEGFVGMGVVKEPTDVFTPGTDKGISLRTPAMETVTITNEDLGYTLTPIIYAEVPEAFRSSVVDGWFGGTANVNYAWVGGIINTFYYNYLTLEATAYVVNDNSLSQLTAEDREIVTECFAEISNKSFDVAEDNEALYMQKLSDEEGVEVIVFNEEQIQTMAKYIRETTWPKLEEFLTPELMDKFRVEVGMEK